MFWARIRVFLGILILDMYITCIFATFNFFSVPPNPNIRYRLALTGIERSTVKMKSSLEMRSRAQNCSMVVNCSIIQNPIQTGMFTNIWLSQISKTSQLWLGVGFLPLETITVEESTWAFWANEKSVFARMLLLLTLNQWNTHVHVLIFRSPHRPLNSVASYSWIGKRFPKKWRITISSIFHIFWYGLRGSSSYYIYFNDFKP